MCVLARGIKRPFDVSVQCPHDTDAGHHGRPIEIDDQGQGLDRGLAFLEILLGLRKLRDVIAGVCTENPIRVDDVKKSPKLAE
jgi:hypothetical protein